MCKSVSLAITEKCSNYEWKKKLWMTSNCSDVCIIVSVVNYCCSRTVIKTGQIILLLKWFMVKKKGITDQENGRKFSIQCACRHERFSSVDR